ncbi:hypothetical protein [Streptomyces sp. NPDC048659]|uniref:hypothetical protein n=1 Tax=Streptomyces sp. NPDC048659 TaxID=3155489 RepID=UPI00342FE91D
MRGGQRFDQRAVALVELRGTAADCELLERAFEERGWPVFERRGRLSSVADRLVWYVVEARFPGSRRNATRGARERVELLGDELLLDLQVQAVELVARDPADLPHWFAYERPAAPPRGAAVPRRRYWRERTDVWRAEHTGSRDTGRLILARTPGEAQYLAARPLPGTAPRGGRVAARRPSGTTTRPAPGRVGRKEGASRMTRTAALLCVGLWAGARLVDGRSHGAGSWWWVLGVLCVVAAGAGASWRAMAPGATRAGSLVAGCLLTVAAAGLGARAALSAPDVGFGSSVLLVCLIAAVVVNGVRLLVRQWSWQRTAPWLIPLLVPLFFGFVPGLGLGIHTMYLDAFGLDLEDVDVPRAHQLLAMLKLAACMSLWLFVPSLLGYMKHFHLYVKDRWFGNVVLLVVSVALLTLGVLEAGLLRAGQAGADAVAAAAKGRTPAGYYGIEPEWVCVLPVGRADAVPVDGGVLSVSSPYLRIGDAGGTVVLWDTKAGAALKAPLDRLRIAPHEERPGSCPTR